jgi:hypothetical protein
VPTFTVEQRNGWAFICDVTSPGSADPIGPTDRSSPVPGRNGAQHYFGSSCDRPSTMVLRGYFDRGQALANPTGYVQIIDAFAFGVPIPVSLLPGLAGRRFYADSNGHGVLDFMGPKDAVLRLGTATDIVPSLAVPFYPLSVFQWFPASNIKLIGTHPMQNGSVYIPDVANAGGDNGRPASQTASIRTVVAPFLVNPASLAAVCPDAEADYNLPVAANFDYAALLDAILTTYAADGVVLSTFSDVLGVGPYIVLLSAENDAVVARVVSNAAGAVVTLWQLEHDIWNRLEHDASMTVVAAIQDYLVAAYSLVLPAPPARTYGDSGLALRPRILNIESERPLLELRFTAVAIEALRTRPGAQPRTQCHGGVVSSVRWDYDPLAERLSLNPNVPFFAFESDDGRINGFINLYNQLRQNPPAADQPDLAAFTVAGLSVADTAPARTPGRGG